MLRRHTSHAASLQKVQHRSSRFASEQIAHYYLSFFGSSFMAKVDSCNWKMGSLKSKVMNLPCILISLVSV